MRCRAASSDANTLTFSKLIDVQTFVAEAPVKGVPEPVIRRLSRAREIQLHAVLPSLLVEDLRGEFGAMVHGDRAGQWTRLGD